jgi:hypothetical protein
MTQQTQNLNHRKFQAKSKSAESDAGDAPVSMGVDRRKSSANRVAAAAAAEAAEESLPARVVIGVDDMIHLGELSESSILSNIQSQKRARQTRRERYLRVFSLFRTICWR